MTTNEIEVVARRLMERIHVEEFCTRRSIGKRHHVVGLADYDVFCELDVVAEDVSVQDFFYLVAILCHDLRSDLWYL